MDAPPGESKDQVPVTAEIETGAVLLRGPAGLVNVVFRLDEARALPPGDYEIRWIRAERSGEDSHFMISATGAKGEPVAVAGDGPVALPVEIGIRFRGRARRDDRGVVQMSFGLLDPAGRGLSVYENDRRVEISYELLDGEGAVLSGGPLGYG